MADWRELRKQLMARQQGIPDDENNILPEGFGKLDDETNEEYRKRWHSQFNSVPAASRRAARELAYRGYIEDELSEENRPTPEEIVESGYGEDRRDVRTSFDIWAENPSEYRAQSQSAWSKFGNGLFKMVPTAASTFLDNTIGLIYGLGNVAVNAGNDEVGATEAFVNNPFSEAMQRWRDWSEKVAPNYRTEEEIANEDEWWKNLNANFWGDTFIKNLGFTIGAGAAGLLFAKGFQKAQGRMVNEAYKAAVGAAEKGDVAAEKAFQEVLQGARMQDPKRIGDTFRRMRQSYGRLSAESRFIGGVGGAMGESRTEALSAAKEFRDEYLDEAVNRYKTGLMSAYRDVMSDPENLRLVPESDGYGNIIGSHPELNERGQLALDQRKQELLDAYNSELGVIENEATKLANTTYWLNMPLLSIENVIMFGRMFSGGFNTQAKSKIGGKFGAYTPTGSKLSAVMSGVSSAAAEGFEEISQKGISEGAKDIAAHNMAAFYNGAYDEDSVKDASEWLLSMLQTAGNVLVDPTSWEEFTVGLLTGGMFSSYGAYKEGIAKRDASRKAVEDLNKTIADPEFRTRWEDMVRHNYLEKQKDEALNKNDSFAWHGLNDEQLINDVMMFANAGRLNDLEEFVDSFADISTEEVQKLRSYLADEIDADFQNKKDEDIQEWLKKRAFDVKRTINQYRDFHDSIDFLSFGTSDEKAINELIYTKAQLRNFEDRYQRLAREVVAKITPTVQSISEETKANGEPTERAETAKKILESFDNTLRLFGGFALDVEGRSQDQKVETEAVKIDNKRQEAVIKMLESWGAFTKDKKVKNEIRDLQKLIRSRQDFYSRLFHPTFRQAFEEDAKKPEQEAKKLEKKAVEQKVAGYDSVDAVRTAFRAIPQNDEQARTKFMSDLRSTKDSNPYVARFLELNGLYEDYQSVYNKSKNRPDSDSPIGIASQYIADKIFENATSTRDIYENSDDLIPSRATIRQYLRGVLGNSLDETRIEDAVNGAIDTVRDNIKQLVNLNNYHSAPTDENGDPFSKGSLRSEQSENPERDDEGAFPSLRKGQQGEQRSVPKAKKNKDGSYRDKLGRNWSINQKVYLYKLDDEDAIIPTSGIECIIDSFSDTSKGPRARLIQVGITGNSKILIELNDDSIIRMQAEPVSVSAPKITVEQPVVASTASKKAISNEQALAIEDAGIPEVASGVVDETKEETKAGELDYYHQSVPEIDSWQAKKAREIIQNKSISDEEKVKRLAELDLRDFFEKVPSFTETWQALAAWRGQNAFDNIMEVDVNDRVKFVIDPKFPTYNNEPQVLVMLDRGGAEKDLLLTVLHSPSEKNVQQYVGLSDLHQKISEQYASWEAKNDNDLFVFNRPDGKPFTSRVFVKRNGFVVYGNEEKSIKNKPAFDKNAPVMFIGRNNALVQLSGSKNIDKTQLSKLVQKLYDKGGEYNPTGNLYYLSKDSRGKYSIPIRLGVEHYNHNTRNYTSDTFNDINDAIEGVANLVANATVTDTASLNSLKQGLSDKVKELSSVLDVHNLVFMLSRDDATEKTRLVIIRNDIKRQGKSPSIAKDISDVTADWISKTLAGMDLSVNVNNTSNIGKLIEDNILTSNAESMRPKGNDFCFEHWDEQTGKFVETDKQQKVREEITGIKNEPAQEENPVKSEEAKPKVAMPEGKIEKKQENKPKEAPMNAKTNNESNAKEWQVSWRDWNNVPESIKNDLIAAGCTEQDWKDMGDEDKKQALGCS